MFYEEIFRAFHRDGIHYAVVGGIAVNLYGIPRSTQDLDIIAAMRKNNILKLVSTLKKLGYVSRLPVDPEELADREKRKEWITRRNLKVFSFYHRREVYRVVDVLLVTPLSYKKIVRSIKKIKISDFYIPLVSIKDLITLKKYAGRKQDDADVEHLMLLLNGGLP